MTDIVSKKRRSLIMGGVRSSKTKLENQFGEILKKSGLKFKRNSQSLFGKPDFSNKSKKIAIFIDSCFWHGCKKHCRMPSSNKKYWIQKIKRNIARDKEVSRYYKKHGWIIIRIWEHDLIKYTIDFDGINYDFKN